jgi:hypothetical protein
MAPKNFYQILNFWGYLKTKKIYLPILHVLMTSKSQQAYNHVFNSLLQLLNDFNIEVSFENKIITAKKFRKDNILFTFCLKLYPFIHNNERFLI